MEYKTKTKAVRAIQFTGNNLQELADFFKRELGGFIWSIIVDTEKINGDIAIKMPLWEPNNNPAGEFQILQLDDWIVIDYCSITYVCTPFVFEENYEPAEKG